MVISEGISQPEETREQGTKKCTFCGYQTNGIYRDMCLDSLGISERGDLIKKVRELIYSISLSLKNEYCGVLDHFINNLLCSYLFFAVELQENCHGACQKNENHKLHELHKMVYKTYRLLEFGDSEQKLTFCNQLADSFRSGNFGAMTEIGKALDAAGETTGTIEFEV